MNDRKELAIAAHMDGELVIVANIGKKVKVSQMELICLVSFAEIGLLSLFSSLDGETGAQAEADLEEHLDAIRKTFSAKGVDGLNRLTTSAAALLRRKKFGQYLPQKTEKRNGL
jgi:hypothetical protein